MGERVMDATTTAAAASGRRTLRFIAAALALGVGVLYFLIATQVLFVAETAGKESPFIPMAAAGAAFVLGAALLVLLDNRIVFLLGAVVQLAVIVGYFAVAPSRDPHVEVWGLLMKAAQLAILALLAYLAVKTPAGPRRRAARA